ncbi:MAG: M23 family metallopeptidase [Pseudomonadota bacterium]
MLTLSQRQLKTFAGAIIAATISVSAAPAYANSSANNAASADMVEPVREAQAERLQTGDPRFRQLFASWRSLDGSVPGLPIERPVIAIPSRMPVSDGRMTSGYGMRRHPVLKRRKKHNGVDIAAPTGTPVYATADGLVGRADWFSSYGLYISIDHGGDLETRYAHLSRLAVAAGERVNKGDIIGYVGSTGRSTGPHLHYEVRVDGLAVNPIPYMVETKAQVALSQKSALSGQGGQ